MSTLSVHIWVQWYNKLYKKEVVMERKTEVLVLLVLSILTACCIFLAAYAWAGDCGHLGCGPNGPGIGQEGFIYVPGDLYPRSDAYERQRGAERLEEIQDSLERIERQNMEIQRLQRWNELQQRHFPPVKLWEGKK